MFDFEDLLVYQKAKNYNIEVSRILCNTSIDKNIRDQLRRASFSIMLNIAEGSSRFTASDRRHFYIISRGSTYECAAIVDYLQSTGFCANDKAQMFSSNLIEISKMLYGMIKNVTSK